MMLMQNMQFGIEGLPYFANDLSEWFFHRSVQGQRDEVVYFKTKLQKKLFCRKRI